MRDIAFTIGVLCSLLFGKACHAQISEPTKVDTSLSSSVQLEASQKELYPSRDAFNLVFRSDGKMRLSSKASPNYSDSDIFISTKEGERWTKPQLAPFSSSYIDFDPFFSVDGRRLYFISNRPVEGRSSGMNIWVAAVNGDSWGAPEYLGDVVNSTYDDSFVSEAASRNLYFCSNRNTTDGSYDIYVSKYDNGTYQSPQRLDFGISTSAWETDPLIAPDESYLIFTRGDFYISFRKNGDWTTPVELSSVVNSNDSHEYTPSFSPCRDYFYFTREKGGKRDIFQIATQRIDLLKSKK